MLPKDQYFLHGGTDAPQKLGLDKDVPVGISNPGTIKTRQNKRVNSLALVSEYFFLYILLFNEVLRYIEEKILRQVPMLLYRLSSS